ncbi:MAG TPA: HNH endonuclease [Marmoricola sp.]
MFDVDAAPLPGASGTGLSAADVRALAHDLVAGARRSDHSLTDAEKVDLLAALEELKSAAAATQAHLTAAFEESQLAEQEAAGVPASRRGRGIGHQVALARRESPRRGGQHLGLAKALMEMPCTLRALERGLLSEWRATLVVRESACLSLEDRMRLDAELAADSGRLEGWGDGRIVAQAKRIAARLDPASMVARARRAAAERHVSIRPAPDTMAWVGALLPVAEGVAVYASLKAAADTARAAGDVRGKGQVMADTLVQRVTGRSADEPVPVTVDLVMTDRALLRGDNEPAHLPGYGTVPAQWARDLVEAAVATTGRSAAGVQAWCRRLFTAPGTGKLISMESRARRFPAGLATFVDLRDQTCRTPWCDAPIAHRDHPWSWAGGGPTTAQNAQGLCEACNHAKQAPGWRARTVAGPRHTVETVTPTGHHYRSTAPPPPGTPPGEHLVPYEIDDNLPPVPEQLPAVG